MTNCTLRPAIVTDLDEINDIYTYSVLYSTSTYETEPNTIEERQAWFARHGQQHPVIVAEVDGKVIGWGSLSPYHTRAAYRHTVEESVYIHHDFHRRGIGKLIVNDLIERARTIGHHRIIAAISGDQEPSLKLHRTLGFTQVGHFTEVGYKFGKWLDVIYYEYRL